MSFWRAFDILYVLLWHGAMLYTILFTDVELWVVLLLLAGSQVVNLDEK